MLVAPPPPPRVVVVVVVVAPPVPPVVAAISQCLLSPKTETRRYVNFHLSVYNGKHILEKSENFSYFTTEIYMYII